VASRRPRSSLRAFAKMLMTYGRGRAEQFRLHPTFGSALNFIPPAFLCYLVVVVAGLIVDPAFGWILSLPLAIYGVAVLLQVAALAMRAPVARSVAAFPLIILTHVLYGFGFWRGLFTRLNERGNRHPVPVELESVKFGPGNST